MAPEHPVGGIPRIERQTPHRHFVRSVGPDHILINMTHARRIIENEDDPSAYFDNTNVITGTIDHSDALAELSWEEELSIVKELEPRWHLPTNYPIYGDYDTETRVTAIRQMMEGTSWMHGQLDEMSMDTEVIPFVKGENEDERNICYTVADAIDAPCCAYDARTAFVSGNAFPQLQAELESINEERPEMPILVVGLMSPNYLSKLPDNVVSAAGLSVWIKNISPSTDFGREMDRKFTGIMKDVDDALGV